MILFGSILFFHGCAAPGIPKKMEIAAVPGKDQKIGFEKIITSKKKNFVSLAPYAELDVQNKIMFMLSIQNHGEEPIEISRDNISVTFEDNTRGGGANKINVQSLDDVMNDFKDESRLKELSFLLDIIDGYKCAPGMGMPAPSEEVSDKHFDFDFARQYDENDLYAGRSTLQTMHEQNQRILEAMPYFIMSHQIIMPGDSYGGVMVCDTWQVNPATEGTFEITVSVDGEEHAFAFNVFAQSMRMQ